MSELSGINSAKYFAQNTVYRTVVRRSGLLSNKSQQLCLTTQALGFLNPQNMELVHMYKWNLVTSVKLEPKQDEFSIYIIKKKKQEKVTFTAPNRSQILYTGYEVTKFKYNGAQKEYNVYLRGYGLVLEHRTTLQECSEFLYSDMKEVITISDTFGGFAFNFEKCSHLQAILTAILGGCSQVGVQLNKRACLQDEINTMMLDIANTEQMFMNLAEFKVKKRNERRHTNPVDRVLTISEKWFVERDARTYSIIKLLSLSTLCYICRPSDDPQAVVVTFLENEEYRSFEYITTIRDQLISTLYDCTVSLNKDVIISEIPLFASLTIRTPAIQDQVDLEGQLVRNLSQFNPEYPQKENFNVKEYFMMQVFLFNANIPTTLKYTDNNRQFKDVARAIEKLLTYAVPSEQFLRCLSCLLTVKSGYEFFADNQQFREKIIGIICSGLTSAKEMIIFHSLTLMSTILSPRFEEPTTVEKFNKKQLLENDVVVECLFSVLLKNLQQMDTLFVMNCVSVIVLIICDPFSETTDLNQFIVALNRMLDLGRDLFKLFHQSQCLSVIHTAGKIMKTIVEEGRDIEERIQKIQIAALVEGATLQQLHTSLFMIPKTNNKHCIRTLVFYC
ncbi:DnaJ-like proteinue subfamily C GRV2/DNAJC13 N-terminal domain-containing protein [Entamoeba marina]